jgi:hypothetical protein
MDHAFILSAIMIASYTHTHTPSLLSARLLLSLHFLMLVPIGLVFSIHDSTAEVAIQKMIEASQKMITISSSNEGVEGGWGGMNSAIRRHLELQIKTLQNAPRDPDKLERLLKSKRRQKEEATKREDTERLVTEIEMLKVDTCKEDFFLCHIFLLPSKELWRTHYLASVVFRNQVIQLHLTARMSRQLTLLCISNMMR